VRYAALGTTYYNLRDRCPAADNMRKAYELRDRVSARERFDISGQYYRFVTGDLEKAAQAYAVWTQTYLRDSRPRSNLSAIYGQLGQSDKSLAEAREAVQVEPSRVESHGRGPGHSRAGASEETRFLSLLRKPTH
jgi:tetratricopeptide (TPR) repeat protein